MNIPIPSSQLEALRSLGVQSLYLFGSRAQDSHGPLSDYDFAVLMKSPSHKRGDKTYNALYDILSPLCERTLKNDVIDIVFLNDAPLELRMHVVRYGKVLFDDAPSGRLAFEEQTVLEYADYRPILDMFDKAILASL